MSKIISKEVLSFSLILYQLILLISPIYNIAVAATPPVDNRCSTGTLTSNSMVSCTGAAMYEIPIAIPPGTNHMEPSLTFAYNSQSGDSLLGVGWAVSGLSTITRCAADMALDGFMGSINFDENDRLCLDGKRLIPISIPGLPSGVREYRTEPESFARIRAYGVTVGPSGSTPSDVSYFTVETKSGTVIEYGNTIDSRIEAKGKSEARVWAVNRMSDRVGNYVSYLYIDDHATSGDYRISQIAYTGNSETGVEPFNFIKFRYISRGNIDIAPFYQGGSEIVSTWLLSSIDTCIDQNCSNTFGRVQSYKLSYKYGRATFRWHLSTLKVCNANGECLPATTFNWSDETFTSFVGNPTSSIYGDTKWATDFGGTTGSFIETNTPLFADAFFPNISALQNAKDTKTGVISSISLLSSAATLIAAPYQAAVTWIAKVLVTLYKHWTNDQRIPKAKLADVDGDGRIDVIGFAKKVLVGPQDSESVWLSENFAEGAGFYKVARWETFPLRQEPSNEPEADEVKLADFNGDGATDVLVFEKVGGSENAYVYLSDAPSGSLSFSYSGMNVEHIGKISHSALGDFNGDGRTDIANFTPNGHIILAEDQGFSEQFSWGLCGTFGISCGPKNFALQDLILGDVDGDRKTDIIQLVQEDSTTHARIWFVNPEGTGWRDDTYIDFDFGFRISLGDTYLPEIIQPGDFNGDGKMDLAVFTGHSGRTRFDTNGDGRIDKHDIEVMGATVLIYLSTGNSFIYKESFSTSMERERAPFAFDYPGNCPTCPSVSFLGRFGDFNGDGKTDIVTFDPTYEHNTFLWLSDGNRFRQPFVWGSGNLIDEMMLGDFDGDGRTDTLNYTAGDFDGELHVVLNNNYQFPDLLVKITDGFGAVTEFSYQPLSNDSVYTGHTSQTGHDVETINFQGPLYVVSSWSRPNGIALQGGGYDSYTKQYVYTGAKTHLSYGFLGFSKIEILDLQTSVQEIIEYEQKFPLVCHVKKTNSYRLESPELPPISSEINTWSVSRGSAPHIVRLLNKQVTTTELDGTRVKDDLVEYLYDEFNNVIESKVWWPSFEMLVRKTTNVIYNDPDNWILGLPIQSSIERFQPLATPERTINRIYDTTNNIPLLLQTSEEILPGKILTTEYKRDDFGNIREVIQSGPGIKANSVEISYDTKGTHPVAILNSLGHRVEVKIDPKFGNMSYKQDPNHLRTSWEYDGFGRLITELRADGTTSTVNLCSPSYSDSKPSSAVQWIKIEHSGAPESVVYIDRLGRAIRSGTTDFNGDMAFSDISYDSKFQISSRSLPYKLGEPVYNTTYQYDILGRSTVIEDPDGSTTLQSYQGNVGIQSNPFSSLTSELLWRKTLLINPLGQQTEYIYNRLDQLNQVNKLSPDGTLLSTLTYEFDPYDNPVGMSDSAGNVSRRTFQHDYQISIDDPDQGQYFFEYNVLGQLVRSTDPRQNETTWEYDLLGRTIKRTIFSGSTVEEAHSWHFDTASNGIGLLAEVTNSVNGFKERYSYDNFSRPIKAITTVPENSDPFITKTSYDNFGRVDVLTYPGPTNIELRHSYNEYGYLSTVQNVRLSTPYWQADNISSQGLLLKQTQGNGLSSRFTYDPSRLHLTRIESGYLLHSNPIKPKKDLAFFYDKIGNLIYRQNLTNLPAIETTESFAYNDHLNRLNKAVTYTYDHIHQIGSIQDEREYTYNPIGNMTYKSDLMPVLRLNPNYFYPESGERTPHAPWGICDDELCWELYYDVAGNTISSVDFHHRFSPRAIEYFSFNKPASIHENNKLITFEYNHNYQKIRQESVNTPRNEVKEYIGQIFEKVTDLDNIITEYRHYIYGVSSSPVALHIKRSNLTEDIFYLHYDHLGSVDAITDQSGSLLEDLSFDPHGTRRNPDWSPSSTLVSSLIDRGFTGHEHIEDFGIIDMKGRIYDSKIGRFLVPDPFVTDSTSSENANRYSYVNNNPLSFIDPSGYQTELATDIAFTGTSSVMEVFGTATSTTLDSALLGSLAIELGAFTLINPIPEVSNFGAIPDLMTPIKTNLIPVDSTEGATITPSSGTGAYSRSIPGPNLESVYQPSQFSKYISEGHYILAYRNIAYDVDAYFKRDLAAAAGYFSDKTAGHLYSPLTISWTGRIPEDNKSFFEWKKATSSERAKAAVTSIKAIYGIGTMSATDVLYKIGKVCLEEICSHYPYPQYTPRPSTDSTQTLIKSPLGTH